MLFYPVASRLEILYQSRFYDTKTTTRILFVLLEAMAERFTVDARFAKGLNDHLYHRTS